MRCDPRIFSHKGVEPAVLVGALGFGHASPDWLDDGNANIFTILDSFRTGFEQRRIRMGATQ
jgi:hypothetical protein